MEQSTASSVEIGRGSTPIPWHIVLKMSNERQKPILVRSIDRNDRLLLRCAVDIKSMTLEQWLLVEKSNQ